jgi:hypothetical protein
MLSLYLPQLACWPWAKGASADGSPGHCCSQKIDFHMLGEVGPP